MNRLRLCAVAIAALVMAMLTPTGAGATFAGDNGRIIFTRGSIKRPVFLVSMNPNGSDQTRLTPRTRDSFGASWDPDGSRFVYSRFNNDGTVDLWLRDADGGNPTRVTDTPRDEFQAAFGPDGNQVVYQRCGFQCDLFKVDLTTGTRTRLTSTRGDELSPDWSVDNLIVFERFPRRRGDAELFTIDSNGANRTRLTDNRHRIQDIYRRHGPRTARGSCTAVVVLGRGAAISSRWIRTGPARTHHPHQGGRVRRQVLTRRSLPRGDPVPRRGERGPLQDANERNPVAPAYRHAEQVRVRRRLAARALAKKQEAPGTRVSPARPATGLRTRRRPGRVRGPRAASGARRPLPRIAAPPRGARLTGWGSSDPSDQPRSTPSFR